MKPIFTLVIEDDERIGAILAELISSTPGYSLLGRAESLAQADLMMRAPTPSFWWWTSPCPTARASSG